MANKRITSALQAAARMERKHLVQLAFALRERAAGLFPELLEVGFVFDAGAEEGDTGPGGDSRQRAYFVTGKEARAKDCVALIGMAPRLAFDPQETQAGVILHELGHAIDALVTRGEVEDMVGPLGRVGAEARADIIGGFLAGQLHPILYSPDTWIQVVGTGIARPRHLPA